MCFSLRLSEMNVLYISSDCRGVTQSFLLHTRTGPVDGATALLETWSRDAEEISYFSQQEPFVGNNLEWNPPFCALDQETPSFLPPKRKEKKRKKLNEHVLTGQINLLQKFKVENNFDLDEMDES